MVDYGLMQRTIKLDSRLDIDDPFHFAGDAFHALGADHDALVGLERPRADHQLAAQRRQVGKPDLRRHAVADPAAHAEDRQLAAGAAAFDVDVFAHDRLSDVLR